MKVKKTVFNFEGGTLREISLADTIEWNGRKWIVPYWLDNPKTGTSRPERIVCLDLLPHQPANGPKGAAFVLTTPLPKAVWDGTYQDKTGTLFLVVENPPIEIPTREILFPEA